MTKQDQKQIDRAMSTNDARYIAATVAAIHRASNAKTQRECVALAAAHSLPVSYINGAMVA